MTAERSTDIREPVIDIIVDLLRSALEWEDQNTELLPEDDSYNEDR